MWQCEVGGGKGLLCALVLFAGYYGLGGVEDGKEITEIYGRVSGLGSATTGGRDKMRGARSGVRHSKAEEEDELRGFERCGFFFLCACQSRLRSLEKFICRT